MKFKNSNIEDRVNTYWNAHVVTMDRKIKDYLGCRKMFTPSKEQFMKLIEEYIRHANVIIDNVSRYMHAETYEDKDYILNYIQDTKAQIISDLYNFKALVVSRLADDTVILHKIGALIELYDGTLDSHGLGDDVGSSYYGR